MVRKSLLHGMAEDTERPQFPPVSAYVRSTWSAVYAGLKALVHKKSTPGARAGIAPLTRDGVTYGCVLERSLTPNWSLNMSASAHALQRTPTILPFLRSAPDGDELLHIANAGELSLPNGLDQHSDNRFEVQEAFALSSLKKEMAEWHDKDIPPNELLFLLASFFFSAGEARRKCQDLLEEFGSLGAIFSAPRELIGGLIDNREDFYIIIKSVHFLISAILKERILDKPILNDQTSLYDYLRVSLSHQKNEAVRLLFLNSKNALILDELHSKGTVNHTPVYPREIVRRVIEIGANALIIVHNHPCGDPTPSEEDVHMTRLIGRVLNDIGVILHDHVIVGLHRCQSMRALRLI